MGRDDHNSSEGKNRLAQTPKNLVTDNKYVELSDELSHQDNKEARQHAEEQTRKMKRQL